MAVNDPKLKIEITADSRSAQRAVTGLYNDVNKLGGSFTAAFGGAIPMAGAAAAAITGIAAAAIGVGSAIFDMTKAASEYGSAIFDATEKTGLSAEVMSSFKVAAEQSGSSLDVVTGGLAKFAKTIGAAGDGSEEAQKKLAKIGVTSNDLETALGQALKTIAKYPPGIQQMTAAQAAFGKSGADLLPFIKSFDGDLPGLIAKMKELGITMSDQDAKAADEFGDTLDTLTKQAAATGRQFAMEMMPAITNAMKAISGVITDNQSAVHVWGNSVGEAVRGVQTVFRLLDGQVQLSFQAINYLFGVNMKATVNWAQFIFDTALPVLKLLREIATIGGGVSDSIATATDTASGIVTRRAGARMPDMPDLGGPGKKAGSSRSTADNAAREAEERRRKEVQAAESAVSKRLELLAIGYKDEEANFDAMLLNKEISEAEHIRRVGKVRAGAYYDEKKLLQEQLLDNTNINLSLEERAEIMHKIRVLDAQTALVKKQVANAVNTQIKAETEAEEKRLAIENERLKKAKEARQIANFNFLIWKRNEKERQEIEEKRRKREKLDSLSIMHGGGIGQGIAGGLGVELPSIFAKDGEETLRSQADFMKAVWADVASSVGQSIGFIADGLANLVTQWLITGEFSAKAALQMAAGAAIGLAFQAGFKAIFEVAEGLAAAARYDFASASLHFAAAKMYGTIALISGVAGVGLGLASRAVGGGNKGQSNSTTPGRSSASEPLTPYSRASATAYQSGQNNAINHLASEVARLHKTIGSMKPEDVLTVAAKRKPGFFAMQTANDISRNSALGSKILRNSGVR